MKISMCMIVKDAADLIEETIASFIDDVDELIVVDTGSSDGTLDVARSVADRHAGRDEHAETTVDYERTKAGTKRVAEHHGKLVMAHFPWQDDFAAARTYADSLATGDYLSWCDADDTVHGIPNLRRLAEERPDINAFYVNYEYAIQHGQPICELWRERLVKRGEGKWMDRVHESQYIQGVVMKVEKELARWTHRKPPFEKSERNTIILEKWLADEPQNPRVLSNLARDYMSNQRFKDAVPVYERYLTIPGQQPDTRAQANRQLCSALCAIGRFEWAHSLAIKSFGEHPTWPDTYLTLAEMCAARGDWRGAVQHAETVIRLGQPDTLLIVNPQDYDERPRAIIASAAANTGQVDRACELAEQVLSTAPGFMDLDVQLAQWQSERQKDQTAAMWAQCAGLLVAYDEPLKARALLETVPSYVIDHPQVINARVQTRDAVEEPYTVERISEGPRAEFLLRGLREQAESFEEVAA
jgi:glycosyltransferase involved in cell wall biosynthesis